MNHTIGKVDKALKPIWIQAHNQEPTLENHSRAAPSVKGPDTRRNFGGRRIKRGDNFYFYCVKYINQSYFQFKLFFGDKNKYYAKTFQSIRVKESLQCLVSLLQELNLLVSVRN